MRGCAQLAPGADRRHAMPPVAQRFHHQVSSGCLRSHCTEHNPLHVPLVLLPACLGGLQGHVIHGPSRLRFQRSPCHVILSALGRAQLRRASAAPTPDSKFNVRAPVKHEPASRLHQLSTCAARPAGRNNGMVHTSTHTGQWEAPGSIEIGQKSKSTLQASRSPSDTAPQTVSLAGRHIVKADRAKDNRGHLLPHWPKG